MSENIPSNFRNSLNFQQHSFKDYIIPLALFILFLLAAIVFFNNFKDRAIWENMELAGGNAFMFCEHNNMSSSLVQTSNTWSNLGFLLLGLFLLFVGFKDAQLKQKEHKNLLIKHPVFSIILGISVLYLFFGSFFYHASVTYFFQMIDQTGMYAIILCLMAYNVFRMWPEVSSKSGEIKSTHNIIVMILLVLDVLFLTYLWKVIDINILFTSLALSFIAFSVVYALKTKTNKMTKLLLFSAVLVYFSSMTLWVLDRQDILCDPESWFQGHSMWHILNALSVFLIYLSYRAESLSLKA